MLLTTLDAGCLITCIALLVVRKMASTPHHHPPRKQ
jgi:hypothetical protein